MNVGDYIAGSSALVLTVALWPFAAARLQRRLLPSWDPAAAVLARAVIALSGLVVVAELMGLADGLRRWPLAVVSAAVAAIVAALGRPAPARRRLSLRLPTAPADRLVLASLVVCVMSISAVLLGRDARALHTGPTDLDSLHYHLTQAAQMVQTHNLDHLHQTAASDGTLYYPFNVELLDAIAMLGPRPDIATFGLNLLFGWLALLACWVIGARWRVGAAGVAGGAVVLALPIVAGASSGPGLNDIPGMAFLLAGVACLLIAGLPRAGRPRPGWLLEIALAGLALGLAAGTKLPLVAPVLLIAIGATVVARGDRIRVAVAIGAAGLLTGSFWYLRDWVIVGSPQPSLDLRVAGHGLTFVPYPEVKPYSFTVAHYLGNWSVIRHWFVPGLKVVWTSAWPVAALLMAAGAVLAIGFDRAPSRRMLGVVTVLGFIAYLLTPTTAIGAPNQPVLFATNTRYAIPVLALAMVLLATAELLRRHAVVVTVGLTGFTIVLLLLSRFIGKVATAPGIAAAIVVCAAGLWGAAVFLRSPWRHCGLALGAVSVVALVVVGGVLQHKYLKQRYAVTAGPNDAIYSYLGGLTGARIGVSGHGLEYPFYGPTFANRVNYVGVTAPDNSFGAPGSCSQLVHVLVSARDQYLVIEPLPLEHTARLMTWTAAIPGVRQVMAGALGTVYRLPPRISSSGCVTAPQ